jgi:hypothetical protein
MKQESRPQKILFFGFLGRPPAVMSTGSGAQHERTKPAPRQNPQRRKTRETVLYIEENSTGINAKKRSTNENPFRQGGGERGLKQMTHLSRSQFFELPRKPLK